MTRATAFLLAVIATAIPFVASAQQTGSPHRSTDTCPICHNQDMSLARSKVETCTLCHAPTVHGGSHEHLQASATSVAQALSAKPENKGRLPLTDDGRIWCGTCHLFHDPSISNPPWLSQGWIPPDTGLPDAVRDGVLRRSDRIMEAAAQPTPGVTFAKQGTRALRLPVADGTLCLQCHARLP
jgi:ribosomal protein L37AE/L43A